MVRFFSPLAWGLPCPQWWVTWARSERARSCSSSISLVNLSQSFNLPLSTSHQVLLVLYLSPLLLAWGLQLLILLLLPALQSSIYKGLSSLASTSLSFYQVHGPETHPIGLNQTELVSIHQYWPQSTTNGLNQSELVLIHQTWSQSIRIGLIHENWHLLIPVPGAGPRHPPLSAFPVLGPRDGRALLLRGLQLHRLLHQHQVPGDQGAKTAGAGLLLYTRPHSLSAQVSVHLNWS